MTKNRSLFYALTFVCAMGFANSVAAKATTTDYFKLAIPAALAGAAATGATEAILDYCKQTNYWVKTVSVPAISFVAAVLASKYLNTAKNFECKTEQAFITILLACAAPLAANNWAPENISYLSGWASHLG